MKPYLSTLGAQGAPGDHQGAFPFTIVHEGHLGGSYTLYAGTEEIRSMWGSKLVEAVQLRQKSSKIFKAKILNRESFLMKTGVSNGYLPQSLQLTRTVNCVTPFSTSRTTLPFSLLTNSLISHRRWSKPDGHRVYGRSLDRRYT